MEILGKSRPPGDSVESLALAHLCDGSNEDVSPKIHNSGKDFLNSDSDSGILTDLDFFSNIFKILSTEFFPRIVFFFFFNSTSPM